LTVSLLAVIVDCKNPREQADFWAFALRRQVTERNPDEFQVGNPADGDVSLYFMRVPEPKVAKNRLHIDLLADGSMEAEVERLLAAGAQLVEVREDPESFENPDRWTVMTDPEGNEFCVTSQQTLTGWTSSG